jgi:hypothetical protein
MSQESSVFIFYFRIAAKYKILTTMSSMRFEEIIVYVINETLFCLAEIFVLQTNLAWK